MSYNNLQERFRRDGVAHMPGAFTPDEMDRLEEFWQFCLDHPGPLASRIYADKNEFVPGQGLDAARALPDRETGFAYQDVSNPANRPRFGELIHLPGIQSIVAAAFGARRAWGVAEQIFLKEPDSPRTTWHQDISDLRVEGMDAMTMWLCLDPVSAEESLELVRGSHLGPVYDSFNGNKLAGPVPDIEGHRDDYDIVSFACQPGDAVLFHLGVLHGGGQTGVAYTRRSVALRFAGPDCRGVNGEQPVTTDLPVFSD